MAEFWCRWVSTCPITTFEYHGPWWISGHAECGPTICAAIVAECEEEAETFFQQSYDVPPDGLYSFTCEELRSSDPFSSRFKRRDWMVWPINTKEALEMRKT